MQLGDVLPRAVSLLLLSHDSLHDEKEKPPGRRGVRGGCTHHLPRGGTSVSRWAPSAKTGGPEAEAMSATRLCPSTWTGLPFMVRHETLPGFYMLGQQADKRVHPL